MAAFRILVLVGLFIADFTQADDFISSPGRVKRQAYGGFLGGSYGGYPYSGGASPYSYNSGYGYPYTGGNYGDLSPYSAYNNYPYSSNLGYSTGDSAYPYSTGYSGYPYSGGYYGGGGQYY